MGLVFTYLLTYGGALASIFKPWYGCLIYFCFAVIRPEAMWYWSVPRGGQYSRIVALALLAGWALDGFGKWKFGRGKPVVYCLLGFFLWHFVSAFSADHWPTSIGFIEARFKIVLPFIVGMTLIDSELKLKQLAWTLALAQGYVAYELNLSYFEGFNRLQAIGFGGMDNNANAIAFVTGAGLAFFLGLYQTSIWARLILFGCAALNVHGVMISFSRGGMLALFVTGAVSAYFIATRPKYYWALALGVVLAIQMAGPQVLNRFTSTFTDEEQRDRSASSRIEMWESCWDLMKENPVFGIGPGHWPRTAPEYGWAFGKSAHSLWLENGAELGFVGLGLLLGFYGTCMLGLWKVFRRRNELNLSPFLTEVPSMVIVSICGFMASAQFVTLTGLELPYYVTLVGAGGLMLATPALDALDASRRPAARQNPADT